LSQAIKIEWTCPRCRVLCISDKPAFLGEVYRDSCWKCGTAYTFKISEVKT